MCVWVEMVCELCWSSSSYAYPRIRAEYAVLCDMCYHVECLSVSPHREPPFWLKLYFCRRVDGMLDWPLISGVSGALRMVFDSECWRGDGVSGRWVCGVQDSELCEQGVVCKSFEWFEFSHPGFESDVVVLLKDGMFQFFIPKYYRSRFGIEVA